MPRQISKKDIRLSIIFINMCGRQCKEGKDPELEAKRLMNKAVLAGNADKLVLVSDEVGSGIVPIDAFEREFREKNGRVNCYLAGQAEQVIRVTAGIGTRIK